MHRHIDVWCLSRGVGRIRVEKFVKIWPNHLAVRAGRPDRLVGLLGLVRAFVRQKPARSQRAAAKAEAAAKLRGCYTLDMV